MRARPSSRGPGPRGSSSGAGAVAQAGNFVVDRSTMQMDARVVDEQGKQQARIQMAYEQKRTPAAPQPAAMKPEVIVHATIVVDTSGSMALLSEGGSKTRMDVVLDLVQDMIRKVLRKDDRVTLAFFNTTYIQDWVNCPVSTILDQFTRVRDKALSCLQQSGQTALWDKSEKALTLMKKAEKGKTDQQVGKTDDKGNLVLRELVVFTDGEDNASKLTLPEMVHRVKNENMPNFHYKCMVVGAPIFAASIEKHFQGVKRAQIISEADCSLASMRRAFQRANTAIQKTKKDMEDTIVEHFIVTVEKKVPKGSHAAPVVPAVIRQIQGICGGGSGLLANFEDRGRSQNRNQASITGGSGGGGGSRHASRTRGNSRTRS
uniref:VWFA domain-containing protein n=1 Tax=Chlamydomonas leiostraca TaxID=1034604 RepID=A0A7S0RZP4_9CHLO|mmetsp:Transcript_35359/g.89520  ORF Transcript_35359/g.89520 Transcript_35359/m.89520 type:complete len:375 (+) Transcript_35359:42-1166(+)